MTHRMIRIHTIAISCSSLIVLLMSTLLLADQQLTPRIQIGLNLIPAVLAANKNLNTEQKVEPLRLYIVYVHDRQRAMKSLAQLQTVNNIRGHELLIKVINFRDLMGQNIQLNDALFIIEPMAGELESMIHYARKQQVILFSPFKSDVKKGVMAGFEVTNKVLPAINLTAMRNSNIDLKAFFLRIAIKYDQ